MSKAESTETTTEHGVIQSVSGPVVSARDLDARMNDVVYVGDEGLMGEVIEIEGDITTVQVYEETSGVSPGEPVENTGEPLSVDLGPGMLDAIYDGVQRPLDVLEGKMGSPYLDRGVDAPGIDLDKEWEFEPTVEVGDEVGRGDVVGVVEETVTIDHKVMVPPDALDEGETTEVTAVESGTFDVTETVAELANGTDVSMHQEWPVREARPSANKKTPRTPLVSGSASSTACSPSRRAGRPRFRGRSAPGRRSRSTSSRSTPTRTSSSTSAAASAATR